MSQPIILCQYCENIDCSNKDACKEFFRYIIYEKIRKLETELYCLTSLLNK